MSSSGLRTLHVLEEVAQSGHPVGVSELARSLSLPAASVFRSLDALARAGLIGRFRESSRYVTGPAVERLHRSMIARFPMREICLPYLRQLASISGESSSLHAPVGWYTARVCSVPGSGDMMTMLPAREIQPLNQSAAGQAILAFLPRLEVDRYRKWCAKRNPQPAPGRRAKRITGLDQIAISGFATGEAYPGSRIIAFPVRCGARAVAAIAIESPLVEPGMRDQLLACQQVISNIEALASAQPALFVNPFAHLDPDSVRVFDGSAAPLRPE